MATRKQIAAARRNIKKAHAALRKSGRKSGRKSSHHRASSHKACTTERWSGPCRARSGKFKRC
jgi:hypothetical protein